VSCVAISQDAVVMVIREMQSRQQKCSSRHRVEHSLVGAAPKHGVAANSVCSSRPALPRECCRKSSDDARGSRQHAATTANQKNASERCSRATHRLGAGARRQTTRRLFRDQMERSDGACGQRVEPEPSAETPPPHAARDQARHATPKQSEEAPCGREAMRYGWLGAASADDGITVGTERVY